MDEHNAEPMSRELSASQRDPQVGDDRSLDRAIQQALSVAPSAEFVARVRLAIREERPARTAHGWWSVFGGAAAAAAVLVAVLTLVNHRTPAPHIAAAPARTNAVGEPNHPSAAPPLQAPAPRVDGSSVAAGATSVPDRRQTRPTELARNVPGAISARGASSEVEVLIAPEERAGWRRLLGMVAASRQIAGLDVEGSTLDPLTPPANLSAPLLAIEPIVVTQ